MNTLLHRATADLRQAADEIRAGVVEYVNATGQFTRTDAFLLTLARWLDIFARFGEKAAG